MQALVHKTATISARIIRANGAIENLGVIAKIKGKTSLWDKLINFIKRWIKQ